MSTTTIRTDHSLQKAVQSELEWTPDVDAAGLGVAVDDGVVTLSGEVSGYAERSAAKRAAERVQGVTTVVDDMTTHPTGATWIRSDVDVAKAVQVALELPVTVPPTVKAEVREGVVTLTGTAEWNYQRAAARRAVEHIPGVSFIDNRIALTPRASSTETAQHIKAALIRNASVDADHITVAAEGTRVTLTGTVRSWAEKYQAGYAAWCSPHVTEVDNLIRVQY